MQSDFEIESYLAKQSERYALLHINDISKPLNLLCSKYIQFLKLSCFFERELKLDTMSTDSFSTRLLPSLDGTRLFFATISDYWRSCGGKLWVGSEKMKKEGLVEVVTRERHSLNEPPWLPPTNQLIISMKRRRYL